MKQLLIILAVLLLPGCSARKKEVQRTETKRDYSSHFDSLARLMEQTKSQALKIQASLLQQHNMHIEYDGAAGDSLDIKQYGPDGKVTGGIVIKGKGKANISDSRETAAQQLQESSSTEHNKELKAEGNKELHTHATDESLDKHIQSFNLSWLWWLLLIPVIWFLYTRGIKTYHSLKNKFTSNSQKI